MSKTIVIAKTDAAAAAVIAKARGDNKRATAAQLEGAILSASSSYEALLDVLRNSQVDQKQVQARAFAARFYAMDYMDEVKLGKVKEQRDAAGNVVIPPMTDALRLKYQTLLKSAAPDAKTLKPDQVRATKEQWQRKSTLRTWWTRLLYAAGVKTVDTRGGKRATKGKTKVAAGVKTTAAPAKVAAVATPVVARVTTPMEAVKYYQTMATQMMQFTQLNRTATEKGKPSPTDPFAKLVADFTTKVARLGIKLSKSDKVKGKTAGNVATK